MRLKCIEVKTEDSMLYHGLTVGKYYNIIDKDVKNDILGIL